MDSACRFIAAPGAPLHPISPERANQQKHLRPEISLSPSLPNIAGFSQVGISSDVQGKVAQFNSLDIKDVTERRKEREAALRRAVLGREEAENETRKAREEIGALTRELEEYKQREKRVSKRLEQAMEESHRYKEELQQTREKSHQYKDKLQQLKETHLYYQNMYEKEIRRTRKEAYKSQSSFVRSQEEVKAARDSLARMRSRVEDEKSRAEEREKEAFAASYKLVGVQEELARMREAVTLADQEREALETKLMAQALIKAEELGIVADQSRIELLATSNLDYLEHLQKRTTSGSEQGDDGRLAELEQELRWAKKAMKDAEDQVEFMKIECQFRCCSCRVAEKKGVTYEYETSFMDEVLAKIGEMEEALAKTPHQEDDNAGNLSRITESSNGQPDTTDMDSEETQELLPPDENMTEVAFCPQTGTFHTINNTPRQSMSLEQSSNNHGTTTINSNNNITVLPVEGPTPAQPQSESTAPPSHTSVSIPVLLPEQSSLLSLLSAPIQLQPEPQLPDENEERDEEEEEEEEEEDPQAAPPHPQPEQRAAAAAASPPTHQHHHHPHQQTRTITTTTQIPLAASPPPQHDDQSLLAGTTMTRSQAIEQIRLRRGRARSIAAGAMTPRKQMVDAQGPGLGNRRDISAPGRRGRKWDE